MRRWSVIACDQFSSQPDYWSEIEQAVGDAPSTLRMMIPEAYLGRKSEAEAAEDVRRYMEAYLDRGVFRRLEDSLVYVERSLPGGAVRRGLVGLLDLEAYDFAPGAEAPVRATERTILERLPPRIAARRAAPLEMPHVLLFADDPEKTVIEPLTEQKESLEPVYAFELLGGGGSIRGWRVCGSSAGRVVQAALALAREREAAFAVGDGNHSLAAAKLCWEEIKPCLDEAERESHPARFALVELCNLHDGAIVFQPIHRVVFGVDAEDFARRAESFWARQRSEGDTAHSVGIVWSGGQRAAALPGLGLGRLIGLADEFISDYVNQNGGRVDYIHGDETARRLAAGAGCAGFILPRLDKAELMPSVLADGPFPKKSFSIGGAREKRYYLECRRIK